MQKVALKQQGSGGAGSRERRTAETGSVNPGERVQPGGALASSPSKLRARPLQVSDVGYHCSVVSTEHAQGSLKLDEMVM